MQGIFLSSFYCKGNFPYEIRVCSSKLKGQIEGAISGSKLSSINAWDTSAKFLLYGAFLK